MSLPRVTDEQAGLALLAHGVWLAGFVLQVTLVTAPQLVFALVVVALLDPAELPSVVLPMVGLPTLLLAWGVVFGACSAAAGQLLRAGHPLGRPLAAGMAIPTVLVNPAGPLVTAMVFLALVRRETGVA